MSHSLGGRLARGFLLMALSCSAHAQPVLQLISITARAEVISDSPPLVVETPVLAAANVGDTYVAVSGLTGTIKGAARTNELDTEAFVDVSATLAKGLIYASFKNISLLPIFFPPGTLVLHSTASFSEEVSKGSASHGFANSVVFLGRESDWQIPNQGAAGGFSYKIEAGVPTFSVNNDQGWVLDMTGDAENVKASFLSPAWTIGPGEELFVEIGTIGTASIFSQNPQASNFSSTDFGHTTTMSLTLPAGIELVSDEHLQWVSTSPVPESSAWVSAMFGALVVAALMGRHRIRCSA